MLISQYIFNFFKVNQQSHESKVVNLTSFYVFTNTKIIN